MKNGTDYDDVALFLRLLGNDENLDITYNIYDGPEGSSAKPNRLRPTFINMGYNDPGNLQYFSSNVVIAYLSKTLTNEIGGGPVLVCGYGKNAKDKDVGHVWVIDGYIQYESRGSLVSGGYLLHDALLHCVWGWNGQSNGYFSWDTYDAFYGNPQEKDDNDNYVNFYSRVNGNGYDWVFGGTNTAQSWMGDEY